MKAVVEKTGVKVNHRLAGLVVEVFEFSTPEVVDDADIMALLHESFDKVAANHAAAAGHKNFAHSYIIYIIMYIGLEAV